MMTSNLLSRLLPTNPQGRSIYEDLHAHDAASSSDVEDRAGLAIDEENLGFHDDDLAHADAFHGEVSHFSTQSTAYLNEPQSKGKGSQGRHKAEGDRSRWVAQSPRLLEEDGGDDDVPASLLIEGNNLPSLSSPSHQRAKRPRQNKPMPMSRPLNRGNHAHWETAQAQQKLHEDEEDGRSKVRPSHQYLGLAAGNAKEKALWRWVNVTNLDGFIGDVYVYFRGAGIWCILLSKALDLCQSIFVAIFTTFLAQCVDYQEIKGGHRKLAEVLVPHCTKKISGTWNVGIWLFTLHIFYRTYLLLAWIPHLMRIRDFYVHLLDVPDSDMQTISWQDIVARIMALRDANPMTVERISPANRKYLGSQSKERLDAHDIANRLMRQENYLIALFNKDVLDLTLPFPFLQNRQMFSRTLMWNLNLCIMDLVLNQDGQVKQLILKESHRRQLSDALRRRFVFYGCLNAVFAPVIVIYLMLLYFLRYFNEYKSNPSAVGSRQYTPFAEWKFREFNELEHLFKKRIDMSYPFASRYLDQFPKVKTVDLSRFLAFVSGAIVSVLAVVTLWDPEIFLTFEITPDRTIAFYITLLGALWAVMNGSIPEENLVFEPEYALRNVIDYTHYMPNHWQNRLHSDEVKREFASLYKLKIMIFLEEIFSIIITPFILWFSLPRCSEQIIDFFREFTVHVDGLGYVCSFAVFDFKKGDGRKGTQAGGDLRDDYYSTKHGKMAASYYGFLDNYLLNPKTAVQGHVPPGMRTQFHPPPSFPGLMSPTLAADMQTSRLGRSERRKGSRAPTGMQSRTPRFAAVGAHATSPIQSILLDPHHQPSGSGFGARSVRRGSRTRNPTRQGIMEEPMEGDDVPSTGAQSANPYESVVGLDESRWETSPTKATEAEAEADEDETELGAGGAGVLGLLAQFQKAQTDRKTGVNI